MSAVITDELRLHFHDVLPLDALYVWDHFVLDYGAEKVRFVCEPPDVYNRRYVLLGIILPNLCLFCVYFTPILRIYWQIGPSGDKCRRSRRLK